MQLVFGRDELVAKWVSENIGQQIVPPYTAIGGTVDGVSLCSGAVFNDWNGANLEITVFSVSRLSRAEIRAALHYAFIQLGATRLSATTRRSNEKMRRHLARLGFAFEGVSRGFYGPRRSDDAFRFAMFRAQALKWMMNDEKPFAASCS